jgi:hypothetical protein
LILTSILNDSDVIPNQQSPDEDSETTQNLAPKADAGGPYYGSVNVIIEFDASNSYDDEGIVSYFWEFGDGSTATGQQISHKYSNSGNFTVKLTVKDNQGLSDVDSTMAMIVKDTLNEKIDTKNNIEFWYISGILTMSLLGFIFILFFRRKYFE